MRHPKKKVAQPLKYIWPRHREIMRRLVAGDRQTDIAEEMGITQGRLSLIIRSPLFQKEYNNLEKKVQDRLIAKTSDVSSRVAKLQPKALDVLEGIMKGGESLGEGWPKPSLSLRRSCAKDIIELHAQVNVGNNGDNEGMNGFARLVNAGFEAAVKQRERLAKEQGREEGREEGIEEALIEKHLGSIKVDVVDEENVNAENVNEENISEEKEENLSLVKFDPAPDPNGSGPNPKPRPRPKAEIERLVSEILEESIQLA